MRFAAMVLVLALPSLADAAPDARAHLEAGRAHHKLGRFREALAEYERAYELQPVPDLLFNMGQCHRNLKNLDRAIFFFERYLHEAPRSSDVPLVKKLVAELKAEIEEQRGQEEPVQTATVAEAPPPPPLPRPEVEPRIVGGPEPEPEPESDGVANKWWFWTLLVLGAAAVAGGSAYAVMRASAPPDGSIGQIDLR